uniref:Cytochrome P450 n=1 Tax=Polyporus umbellatus TaxID=158314 RepID=A0A160HKT4_9APHY|nr:cytochrome P450 [Polyporus umbellatus]
MLMAMASDLLTVLLTCTIVLFAVYRCRRATKCHLPPGPRPLPILGNVLDFPKKHLGREFRELSRKHGEIVHLDVLGRSVILLGTYEAACEFFEKRSSNNSDRPQSVMMKLTNLDWIFVFKDCTPEWRRHRRAIHNQFLPSMVTGFHHIMFRVTHNLLRDLLKSPRDFSSHIQFSFASSVLRIVYGTDLVQGDRRYYQLAQRLAIIAEDISTPGRHAVEAFQSLQALPSWFPGAAFKKVAAAWKQELISIRDQLYDSARDEMDRHGVKESLITRLIDGGEDEKMIREVTAAVYAAGSDTTVASVHAFFLAMALHPDVQKRAQEELDATIGIDRLPQVSDQESLPYVSALVKEVLRWHVVAPIGVPHRSTEDDEVNGFIIPGGSIVMANIWAMSRDTESYQDPERFHPERFLRNGQLNCDVRDPASYVFGFGRRLCPGRHFAEAKLFITCASILHTFNISPPLDMEGRPTKLDVWMGNDMAVSHLDSFDCRIIVRDTQKEALIRAEWM